MCIPLSLSLPQPFDFQILACRPPLLSSDQSYSSTPASSLHTMYMYASACLLLLSLRCLVSHNPYPTQTRALCTTATAQYNHLTVIPLSYFLAQPRTMPKPPKLFPSPLLLLCGDISLNPGPVSASHSYPAAFVTPSTAAAAPPPPPPLHLPRQTRFSKK